MAVTNPSSSDAPSRTTTNNGITSRARTTANVSWNPAAWPTTLAQGPDQRTSDISSIVQQLVLRPGWATGNGLALIITGSGLKDPDAAIGKAPPVIGCKNDVAAVERAVFD